MKIVDANVLLYAVNTDAPHHDSSRAWLDRALSGGDTVGFTWLALLAFVRISTKPGLFPRPLTKDAALAQVDDWIGSPSARIIDPVAGHIHALEAMLAGASTAGNLVNDAHLAAMAIEQRADVVTYDTDFLRFPDVRSVRPDDLLGPDR